MLLKSRPLSLLFFGFQTLNFAGKTKTKRSMDLIDDQPTTVCLKEEDLAKLRDESRHEGVEFEVKECNNDEEEEQDYFKPEDVLSNTYIPEEEDSDDDEDGLSPFEKLAKKMEDISGDGGVKKRTLHPGGGVVVPDESIVRMHYNAFLEYADEPYDSTRLRNAPERYKLGQGQLLPGLELAIMTMKRGEIAQLLISSDYAYGEMGVLPRIPQKATIMFKLELLNFVEHAGLEDYELMTKDERDAIDFPQILKFVEVERQLGKQQYNERAYPRAFSHYKRASRILENRNVKDASEQRIQEDKLKTLYTNMAICSSKQCRFNNVITYCNKARQYDRSNVKILFLLGKAHRHCSNFDIARDLLKKAQRLSPNNPEINSELQQLDRYIRNFSLLEKDMYKKMFSKPTGQSESEKEKEDEQVQEKEDKTMKVTDNFDKMVQDKLLEFKNDNDQDEMPFPAYNLNIGEITCLMEKALDLGLNCKEIGTGSSYRLKITKEQDEEES